MRNNTRYIIVRTILYIAVVGLAYTVWTMDPASWKRSAIQLAVFFVVGVIATPLYYMYKEHRYSTKTQQQIAVETLAKLGSKKKKN